MASNLMELLRGSNIFQLLAFIAPLVIGLSVSVFMFESGKSLDANTRQLYKSIIILCVLYVVKILQYIGFIDVVIMGHISLLNPLLVIMAAFMILRIIINSFFVIRRRIRAKRKNL